MYDSTRSIWGTAALGQILVRTANYSRHLGYSCRVPTVHYSNSVLIAQIRIDAFNPSNDSRQVELKYATEHGRCNRRGILAGQQFHEICFRRGGHEASRLLKYSTIVEFRCPCGCDSNTAEHTGIGPYWIPPDISRSMVSARSIRLRTLT